MNRGVDVLVLLLLLGAAVRGLVVESAGNVEILRTITITSTSTSTTTQE